MSNGNPIARRALIGTALFTAGAAAGAVVTPIVEGNSQHEAINKAYADGIAAGKQAVINQLKQINGIQLQSALTAAHTTQSATKVIAQPTANMLGTIAGDALSTLVSVLGAAQNLVIFISGAYDLLGKLKAFFTGLQSTVADLSVPVEELGAADTEAASGFLEGVLLLVLDA